MNSKICEAINSKRVIQFDYNGGMWLVEPFCYGISSKGNEILRGYQTGGYSESGKPEGWKLFDLSKVSGLEITNISFEGIRPDYNPNDRAMVRIYCCI